MATPLLRRAARLSLGLVGLVLATAVIAEGVCAVAQQRAFPHVNFYVPDATLGVRLAPLATERISFSGNPVTTIRTNSLGYRGEEWGAAPELESGRGEVLVVGDSQVFGLGVEEDATGTAEVGRLLGRPARNGGVPTYGPAEYLAVVKEVLAARPIQDVVLVFNASNDFFERDRPNRERHAVWDGWAVRIETAPAAVTDFPGRRWLYQQSHAFFAWRRWRHAATNPGEALPGAGLPSEGTPSDLAPIARQQAATLGAAELERRKPDVEQTQALQAAALARDPLDVQRKLLQALVYIGEQESGAEDTLGLQALIDEAHPGDIVSDHYAEGGRRITVTAAVLEQGAALRRTLVPRLEAWLEGAAADAYDRKMVEEALAALAATRGPPVRGDSVGPVGAPESPFHGVLVDAAALCAEHGAALTVVILPLDVQVSETEWAKYGAPPAPMDESIALNREVARDAAALGVRVVDPIAALRAAEPGAFLDGDLHLSAKGQAVLGAEIARAIVAPAPVRWPGSGLPAGRSRVPLEEEWDKAGETVALAGGARGGCSAARVREWVRVRCTTSIYALDVVEAPAETWTRLDPPGPTTLQFPDLPGRAVVIDLLGQNKGHRLRFADGAGTLTAVATAAPPAALAPQEVTFAGLDPRCPTPGWSWVGNLDAGCEGTCEEALGCADGRRTVLPVCALGEANAGSAGHCFALCDDAHPCASGACTPWQGSAACL
ncbi:MAG: hypothetical protein Q8P18_16710 [Pseudomonadota bacterium]|nr:hypothetical protein [Pseudomonadota bacterium]